MKTFCLAALLGAVSAFSEIEGAFLGYITQFGKSYSNMAEYEMRLREFAVKHTIIADHNSTEESFKLGHNQFSDWTDAEYKAILTYKSEGEHVADEPEVNEFYGSAKNWVTSGCVNAIKDQGQCGSCWAFSAVASTEGAECIAHGKLYSFSEQQLVDCDTSCYGCNGGWAYQGFRYFETHYAMYESSYAYTAKDGTCSYSSSNNSGIKTSSYSNVSADSPTSMKSALNGHVLSVAIQADKYVFQMYSGGVFTSTSCGTSLDHATNVVGWGTDSSYGDYWLMRNSWGSSWGDAGYMKLQVVSGKGLCGIQMEPNYTVVA